MANNPPWADKLLNENWDAIHASMEDRGLPFEWLPTHSHGRTKVHPSKELGCGSYGCVYQTEDPDVVCKVTTDISEALFIEIMKNMEHAGELLPPGLVRYFEILALKGKRGKRYAFILWREAAFGFWDGGTPKEFLPHGDPTDPYRKQLWKEFERHLRDFLTWAKFARGIIENSKKRMSENEYWDWVEGQFRAVDENWAEFNEVYSGAAPSRTYNSPRHPLHLAFQLFMLSQIAIEMTNTDGTYLIGEAFQFFLKKKIVLADVHLANIAFVNRDDPDFAPGVPIIVDPGHAVFLSREYSEVPVEVVGSVG